MGKAKGDRAKKGPSSSSMAAALASSSGSLPPVGFGGYMGSTRVDSIFSASSSSIASPSSFSSSPPPMPPAAAAASSSADADVTGRRRSSAASSAAVDDVGDSEASLNFRRLSKKDPTTKLKALSSLREIFASSPTSRLHLLLPPWLFEYKRLAVDYHRGVREAAHVAMGVLCAAVGKQLAPHLKSLIGAWWMAHFDVSREAAAAAKRSFQAAFPSRKRQVEALVFGSIEIMAAVDDGLKQTKQTVADHNTPAEEAEQKLELVHSSALLAAATLLEVILNSQAPAEPTPPGTTAEPVGSVELPTIPAAVRTKLVEAARQVWRSHGWFRASFRSSSPVVRAAAYSATKSFLLTVPLKESRGKDKEDGVGREEGKEGERDEAGNERREEEEKKGQGKEREVRDGLKEGGEEGEKRDEEIESNVVEVGKLVLGAIKEPMASCHVSMWEMLLVLAKKYPQVWDDPSVPKSFIPKLLSFLKDGCSGSARTSLPSLLPFLSLLPPSAFTRDFLESFFSVLWEGRKRQVAASELSDLLNCLRECLLFCATSAASRRILSASDRSAVVLAVLMMMWRSIIGQAASEEEIAAVGVGGGAWGNEREHGKKKKLQSQFCKWMVEVVVALGSRGEEREGGTAEIRKEITNRQNRRTEKCDETETPLREGGTKEQFDAMHHAAEEGRSDLVLQETNVLRDFWAGFLLLVEEVVGGQQAAACSRRQRSSDTDVIGQFLTLLCAQQWREDKDKFVESLHSVGGEGSGVRGAERNKTELPWWLLRDGLQPLCSTLMAMAAREEIETSLSAAQLLAVVADAGATSAVQSSLTMSRSQLPAAASVAPVPAVAAEVDDDVDRLLTWLLKELPPGQQGDALLTAKQRVVFGILKSGGKEAAEKAMTKWLSLLKIGGGEGAGEESERAKSVYEGGVERGGDREGGGKMVGLDDGRSDLVLRTLAAFLRELFLLEADGSSERRTGAGEKLGGGVETVDNDKGDDFRRNFKGSQVEGEERGDAGQAVGFEARSGATWQRLGVLRGRWEQWVDALGKWWSEEQQEKQEGEVEKVLGGDAAKKGGGNRGFEEIGRFLLDLVACQLGVACGEARSPKTSATPVLSPSVAEQCLQQVKQRIVRAAGKLSGGCGLQVLAVVGGEVEEDLKSEHDAGRGDEGERGRGNEEVVFGLATSAVAMSEGLLLKSIESEGVRSDAQKSHVLVREVAATVVAVGVISLAWRRNGRAETKNEEGSKSLGEEEDGERGDMEKGEKGWREEEEEDGEEEGGGEGEEEKAESLEGRRLEELEVREEKGDFGRLLQSDANPGLLRFQRSCLEFCRRMKLQILDGGVQNDVNSMVLEIIFRAALNCSDVSPMQRAQWVKSLVTCLCATNRRRRATMNAFLAKFFGLAGWPVFVQQIHGRQELISEPSSTTAGIDSSEIRSEAVFELLFSIASIVSVDEMLGGVEVGRDAAGGEGEVGGEWGGDKEKEKEKADDGGEREKRYAVERLLLAELLCWLDGSSRVAEGQIGARHVINLQQQERLKRKLHHYVCSSVIKTGRDTAGKAPAAQVVEILVREIASVEHQLQRGSLSAETVASVSHLELKKTTLLKALKGLLSSLVLSEAWHRPQAAAFICQLAGPLWPTGRAPADVALELLPEVMRLARGLGGRGESGGVGGRDGRASGGGDSTAAGGQALRDGEGEQEEEAEDKVAAVIADWLREVVESPPLVALLDAGEEAEELHRSIRVVAAFFPLPFQSAREEVDVDLPTADKQVKLFCSALERDLLLRTFRMQFSREASAAIAAAAAARRSTFSAQGMASSFGGSLDTISGSMLKEEEEGREEQVEELLGRLSAAAVAYAWNDMAAPDWSFVFSKLRKWLDASAVQMEEAMDQCYDEGDEEEEEGGEEEEEEEGEGEEEDEKEEEQEEGVTTRRSLKKLDERAEELSKVFDEQQSEEMVTLLRAAKRLSSLPDAAYHLFALLLTLPMPGSRAAANESGLYGVGLRRGVIVRKTGNKSDDGIQIRGLDSGAWNKFCSRAFEDVLRFFLCAGMLEATMKASKKLVAASDIATWHDAVRPVVQSAAVISLQAPAVAINASLRAAKLSAPAAQDPVSGLFALVQWGRTSGSISLAALRLLLNDCLIGVALRSGSLQEMMDDDGDDDEASKERADQDEDFGRNVLEGGQRMKDMLAADVAGLRMELAEMLLDEQQDTFFIGWLILLHHMAAVPASSAIHNRLVTFASSSSCLSTLLATLCTLMPLTTPQRKEREALDPRDFAGQAATKSIFDASPKHFVLGKTDCMHPEGRAKEQLAGALFGAALKVLPGCVREWAVALRDRGRQLGLESFAQKYCSAALVKQEFEEIQQLEISDDSLSIRANTSVREVTVAFKKDDASLEIVIKLPASYPLKAIEVECTKRMGVSEARLRKWLLSMTTFLRYQNGSISNAIMIWKDNVAREFDGVEECPICYSVIHTSDHSLPRLSCKTCKHKFHKACLYKWFTSSHKSTCPLCQTPF